MHLWLRRHPCGKAPPYRYTYAISFAEAQPRRTTTIWLAGKAEPFRKEGGKPLGFAGIGFIDTDDPRSKNGNVVIVA